MSLATPAIANDFATLQRIQRRDERRTLAIYEDDLEAALREDMGADNADLTVSDLRNAAEELADALSAFIQRLGKIDPRILDNGVKLSTADTYDWPDRLVEMVTDPMTREAARAFGQAVRVRGL